MHRLLFIAAALLLVGAAPAAAGEPAPAHPAVGAALQVPRAIDHFDLELFAAAFTEDVTMFYPLGSLPRRVDGRETLVATQQGIFETLRARYEKEGKTSGPYFGLEPLDVVVQELGADAAVVTWHLDRGTHLGRRTAVVRRVEPGVWKVASFHSSNVDRPDE